MRGCNWLMGLVLLGAGWPGLMVGQGVDMEEVRRRAEKYERDAAEEAAKQAPAVDHDLIAWQSAEKCGTAACFRAYLKKHPQGQYAEMARARLEAEAPPPAPVERPRPTMAGPEMIRIAGVRFQMGSPESETGRESDERLHSVTVRDFEIGQDEVTVGEFTRFVNATGHRTDAERNAGGKEGCYAWSATTGKWDWRAGTDWRNPGFPQRDNYP
ncbi:MAG: SUMF1/EgtB/PvdO family nonheme iron enzyme, partial [Candidatus Contendobacter sp.]|nr:SUMF1/EgtB/PvdO family nonheme iron enzyme [Candidatus Contendobacter sp.]